MNSDAVHSDTLKALVRLHAIKEAVAGRIDGNDAKWTLSIRLGDPTSLLVPVRSRREPLRTWASLTAVCRFAEAAGLTGFRVEL